MHLTMGYHEWKERTTIAFKSPLSLGRSLEIRKETRARYYQT